MPKETTKKKEVNNLVRRMMWRYRPIEAKYDKPTLEGTLICHLNLLQSVIMRRANSAADAEGLTFQQWLALGAVAHKGDEGIRHSELGEVLRLSKAPVTGMVDRLERAHWAVRKPDGEDRRASRIVVTEEGIKAWQRAQHSIRASSQELFASLDEDEKYQLLSMLGSLLDEVAESGDIPGFVADHRSSGEKL
jgi:DNA-binding MarR family transcriptional regulator